MKRSISLSILFLLIVISNALAQKAAIKFEEDTFDFGNIKEENGPVEHKFVFANDGDAPLVIDNVRASCGCTTPAWTREPVAPGTKGFIVAKYNPLNRPGQFRKSLTITSNAVPSNTTVFIQGMVAPKPKKPSEQYPNAMGELRFKYRSLNMGRLTTEKPISRSFDVFNDSDEAITFMDKMDKPDFVQVSFQPAVIKPHSVGKINVTYDPKAKNELGFVSDRLVLYTDEKQQPAKDLRVVATIEEYFPPMTSEELAQAPRLNFDKTVYDFGNIKGDSKVETQFTLTNTGKSDLNIRETKANCGCTVAKMEKNTLKPGESTVMKVTFNATGRRGMQQKSITIFSNDPKAPTQRLIIKARVDDVG